MFLIFPSTWTLMHIDIATWATTKKTQSCYRRIDHEFIMTKLTGHKKGKELATKKEKKEKFTKSKKDWNVTDRLCKEHKCDSSLSTPVSLEPESYSRGEYIASRSMHWQIQDQFIDTCVYSTCAKLTGLLMPLSPKSYKNWHVCWCLLVVGLFRRQ